ncbi:hypothetical protein MMC08_004742, partial [Hypocenomyce scalaris]|nr:hypothetical protein [Hypocenomyce scalaris]
MYFIFSPLVLALALLLSSWSGPVSASPQLAVRQGILCTPNVFLEGFEAEPALATPYCSSFLAIPLVTKNETRTATVSTASITETSVRATITEITTVPSSTVTSTSTVINPLRKRAPAPTPAVDSPDDQPLADVLLAAAAAGDPNLSVSVSSACSCLFITPSTTRVRTTVLTTETVTAILEEQSTAIITVTRGIFTTVTTETLYLSLPPTSNTSTGPTSGASFPTLNPTIVPSSGTAPSFTITPFPPLNTSSPIGTGSFPTASVNITSSVSGSPTYSGFNSSSVPGTGSFPSSTPSSNLTSAPTNSTAAPTAAATSAPGCPVINDTTYTSPIDGEQYEILCDIAYPGTQDVGILQDDIYDCLDSCSYANNGFSSIRCSGVTFDPLQDGLNCFLKTPADIDTFYPSIGAISADLLPDQAMLPNTTSSAAPTAAPTGNSTSLIQSTPSNFTAPAGPPASFSSIAIATTASITASIPLNYTGAPYPFPTSSGAVGPSAFIPFGIP